MPTEELSLEQIEQMSAQAPKPVSTLEEVLDTRPPEEIEKELLAQAEKQALDEYNKLTPAQRSAINFKMAYPIFRQKVAGFSNKDLRRLVDSLVVGDLSKEKPNLKQPVQEALTIGQMLIDLRLIINGTKYLEDLEKVHAQAPSTEQLPVESTVTVERQRAEENTNNG